MHTAHCSMPWPPLAGTGLQHKCWGVAQGLAQGFHEAVRLVSSWRGEMEAGSTLAGCRVQGRGWCKDSKKLSAW